MTFINPVEILGLAATPVNAIDSSAVRKAKKALQAEIELSDDGYFHYRDQTLTPSDCERYIDELEVKDKLEFYHFIASNEKLNNFLAGTSHQLFSSFRHESIYRLPEFIAFISPYFAVAYDKALLQSYRDTDPTAFKDIVSTSPLVTEADMDKAFKGLRNAIEEQTGKLMEMTQQSKDKTLTFQPEEAPDIVKRLVNAEKINAFSPYLHPLRNKLQREMREFCVYLFNSYECIDISVGLINDMLNFSMEEAFREKLLEDMKILTAMQDKKKEEDKYAAEIEEYSRLLRDIRANVTAINTHAISLYTLKTWAGENINIETINQLPEVLSEIRDQLAIALNDLAIVTWNKHTSKSDCLHYLSLAESIAAVKPSTQRLIADTRKKLEELMHTKPEESSAGYVVGAILFVLILFAFFAVKNKRSSNHYRNEIANSYPPATFSNAEYGNPALVTVHNSFKEDVVVILQPVLSSKKAVIIYATAKKETSGANVAPSLYTINILRGKKKALKLIGLETVNADSLAPHLKLTTLARPVKLFSNSKDLTWALIKLEKGEQQQDTATVELSSVSL